MPNRNANSMSFSLEKKAHLVVVFLTNDPAGFSLASLRDEVNSSRGMSTVLKLNRKRLAWGEKSFFDFADTIPLPYRSVELNSVRQMFVESKYPDVLLCVLRIPKHTKFKYEIVAFRLPNDHDVRVFLDLFAALTQTPGPSVDVRKTRDRTTTVFDRPEPHSRDPTSSTLLVRGRNTVGAAAALGKASRDHGNVTWSQPDFEDFEIVEEKTGTRRRRRRRDYDTVDSRGAAAAAARPADSRVYADQTKSVVFSDADTSGTSSTIRRRSDANRKHPKHRFSNGSLTEKSLSSPSIPEASYVARAVVGTRGGDASIAHVPLNDVNGFDGSDSTGEREEDAVAGPSGRNLQRRTTLVDNGIVKVTVEEYRDPEDEKEKTPDRSSNDQDSNPYGLGGGAGSRFVGDSAVWHPQAASRNPAQQQRRGLRKMDTVDLEPSSVRRVHGRSSVQRTLSEGRSNGRHHHGSENPPMDTDVVYHQSRSPVHRQRFAVDNIAYEPRGTAVARNQPIRSRPESLYQSRSTTIRRHPFATTSSTTTRVVAEDAYPLRSATIRSQPVNVIQDPVYYQPRHVVWDEPGYFSERRVARGPSSHHRNDYERWDPVPVQQQHHHQQQPTGRSKRSSVYHMEQRTSRR